MIKLLPCPFCGATPKLEYVAGTFYDLDCDCGIVNISLQISDLMTIDERAADPFTNHKYQSKYVQRAAKHIIKLWNTRI